MATFLPWYCTLEMLLHTIYLQIHITLLYYSYLPNTVSMICLTSDLTQGAQYNPGYAIPLGRASNRNVGSSHLR